MVDGGLLPAKIPELASCAFDLFADVSSSSVCGTAFSRSTGFGAMGGGAAVVPFTIAVFSEPSTSV